MSKGTTEIGYVNPNGQVTIRDTGLPGTDKYQRVYQLACSKCGHNYGANGSDIHERPPESAFTLRPECCSESQRNRVRLQSGIAFTFDRIPHTARSEEPVASRHAKHGSPPGDGDSYKTSLTSADWRFVGAMTCPMVS